MQRPEADRGSSVGSRLKPDVRLRVRRVDAPSDQCANAHADRRTSGIGWRPFVDLVAIDHERAQEHGCARRVAGAGAPGRAISYRIGTPLERPNGVERYGDL